MNHEKLKRPASSAHPDDAEYGCGGLLAMHGSIIVSAPRPDHGQTQIEMKAAANVLQRTIGVVGNGYVGSAVACGFKKLGEEVRVYDADHTKATHSFEAVVTCNFVFLCLPTPSTEEGCDLSALHKTMQRAEKVIPDGICPIFIVKSTVTPGTTEMLATEYSKWWFVSNPEFLTAATAKEDFLNPISIVVGSRRTEAVEEVVGLYSKYFSRDVIWAYDEGTTTELIKYARNVFFSVKIGFLNELYEVCQLVGVPFSKVREGFLTSTWVNEMHTEVPGPDGKLGFGGTCFPKDTKAFEMYGEALGTTLDIVKATTASNKKRRGAS